MNHHALTVLLPFFLFVACAAGPPLPPPPPEEMRAQWRVVELEVLPTESVELEVDAPPTSLLGRMGVGTTRGFVTGAAIGGSMPGASSLFGLAALGVVGGLGGFVIGPFCGESTAVVGETTAQLAASARILPPEVLLGADLRRELAMRGTFVVDRADVRCEVRLTRWCLCGFDASFDPSLAVTLAGELTMRRRSDGEVLHTLPFWWQGTPRRFRAWGDQPSEVAAVLRAASADVATFLADELLCTVDIAWGGDDRATPRGADSRLQWPAARVPADATDLRYEVAVWECADGVPIRPLHTRFVAACSLEIPALESSREVRWSVRAHWRQAGQLRLSRWLAKGQEPVTTARLPAVTFAKL
jgi:hypothetical protein